MDLSKDFYSTPWISDYSLKCALQKGNNLYYQKTKLHLAETNRCLHLLSSAHACVSA